MCKLFAILSIGTFVTILNGWVLSVLWAWFLVPSFGLPALKIPAAIGIATVVGMLTSQYIHNNESEEDEMVARVSHSVAVPVVSLIIGFVARFFV